MSTLLEDPWKHLFKLYFNQEISDAFLNCAEAQLTQIFEKETGIEVYR